MSKQLSLFSWAVAILGTANLLWPGETVASTTIVNNLGATGDAYNGASVVDMTTGPAYPEPAQVAPTKPIVVHPVVVTKPIVLHQQAPAPVAAPVAAPAPAKMYYSDKYNDFKGCDGNCAAPAVAQPEPVAAPAPKPVVKKQKELVSRESTHKQILAHPFFMPAAGHLGSITDVGWHGNYMDFSIPTISDAVQTGGDGFYDGVGGKWGARETLIKEDLVYGLTDNLSLTASAKYGWDRYMFNWDTPIPTDLGKDDQFNQLGAGLTWKFYEDADWIAYIGGFYQWTSVSNNLLADAKVGYKITPATTFYALGRLQYVMWDNNSYGMGLTNDDNQTTFLAVNRGDDSSVYGEFGLGIFSNLSSDWSVNLEATIGSYDWHSQAYLYGAINWQPTNSFALGLYGEISVWDSADSFKGTEAWGWGGIDNAPQTFIGKTDLDNYQDYLIGIKAYLYF